MHIAAVFAVEAHMSTLREEALRNRFAKSGQPSRIRKLIDATVVSLRGLSEPATPRLAAYPYTD